MIEDLIVNEFVWVINVFEYVEMVDKVWLMIRNIIFLLVMVWVNVGVMLLFVFVCIMLFVGLMVFEIEIGGVFWVVGLV